MKLHSAFPKILIFSLICIFFVIPPLIVTENHSLIFTSWNFPVQQLSLALLAVFLLFLYEDGIQLKFSHNYFFYNILFPLIFCTCLLFCFSFFIKGISLIFNLESTQNLSVNKPDSLIKWLFCILNFLFAAFYEEVIYRFYLPAAFLSFFKNNSKRILIITEAGVLLLFSFAHFSYGWLSVLNAAAAHIVLRKCFYKTRSIYAGFAAHFIYNLCQIFLV